MMPPNQALPVGRPAPPNSWPDAGREAPRLRVAHRADNETRHDTGEGERDGSYARLPAYRLVFAAKGAATLSDVVIAGDETRPGRGLR